MDEFGVLTERYGLKPQGKSAPMAASKRPTSTRNGQTWNFGSGNGINARTSSNSSWNPKSDNGSLLDDHDVLFKSNATQNSTGFDDFVIFGGLNKSSNKSGSYASKSSFNDDLLFNFGNSGSKAPSTNGYIDDDIFGGMPGAKTSSSSNDDIFESFASSAKKKASVDDLLGDFGGFGSSTTRHELNGSGDMGKNASSYDDLLSGFGQPSKGKTEDDPFVVLESVSTSANNSSSHFVDPLEEFTKFASSQSTKPGSSSHSSTKLRPPPEAAQVLKPDRVSSDRSAIDELEDFAMGRAQPSANGHTRSHCVKEVRDKQYAKASKYKEAEDASTKTQHNSVDDLESFFSAGHRSNSVPKSRATKEDPVFNSPVSNKNGSEVVKRTSPVGSTGGKKLSSSATFIDDFSSVFGEAASMFGEFEEVEGENEERRRARLSRHQRTNDRVAQAVADMNQRDHQAQLEQEERRRIAERLEADIKRWAAGKEGNMRALLSSLQNVLWAECGWEPVSLTDLITSTSVKKVYRKASLYVHPDKVQQKGATLEQKYTAEKVFDILKEAWTKFSQEELR